VLEGDFVLRLPFFLMKVSDAAPMSVMWLMASKIWFYQSRMCASMRKPIRALMAVLDLIKTMAQKIIQIG